MDDIIQRGRRKGKSRGNYRDKQKVYPYMRYNSLDPLHKQKEMFRRATVQ